MPLQAVLFDMDGVIVNTEPLHKKAFYKVFGNLGIHVSSEFYASFMGSSTKNVVNKLVNEFSLDMSQEKILSEKRKYFKYFFDTEEGFSLLPGVKDLIETYHEAGITLVLASSASKSSIEWVFDKFDLHPYFKDKISGESLQESKPHPEIFEIAARRSGTPKKNCMVIEDSTNGIKAARKAGIFCAAYSSNFNHGQDYSLANIVVENFSSLKPEKLKKYFD
ncbi:MAG: HAD family phosphatase [Bergeyella sp.]|nr:HAD family phosphatase [Bergeyella sp.]